MTDYTPVIPPIPEPAPAVEAETKTDNAEATEALAVAKAYAEDTSMEATKSLLNDADKLKLMEVVTANTEKFAEDDPAWLIVHAITALRRVEDDALKTTAEAAAKEIMKAKVEATKETEKIKKETKEYARDAKIYMQKILASATKNMTTKINNIVDTIEERMTEAMTSSLVKIARESARATAKTRYDHNRPYRWAALAMVACLVLVGGSYYGGMTSFTRSPQYQKSLNDQEQWLLFGQKWQKATKKEKAVIKKVMERS